MYLLSLTYSPKSFLHLGLFNISDKMFVSLDILLELCEMLKTGNPNSLVIQEKLESLRLCASEVRIISIKMHIKFNQSCAVLPEYFLV